jgi:hypothetical protein
MFSCKTGPGCERYATSAIGSRFSNNYFRFRLDYTSSRPPFLLTYILWKD